MGRYYVQTSDGLIVGAPTAPTLDTPAYWSDHSGDP